MNVEAISLETIRLCNFCGHSDFKPYDVVGPWHIVECCQCKFCFTNPRPASKSLPLLYDQAYFESNRFNFFNNNGSLKSASQLTYANRIANIEDHAEQRGNLLEIGAAMGNFLETMMGRGWRTCGIEISWDAVAIARQRNIDIFCGSLEDFRSDEQFDVVCMYETLEHVPDPAFILTRSYELLNPGGLIIIEVPNLESFDAKINKQRRYWNYDLPLHLSHFKPAVLQRKLEAIGFRIVDVDLYYPNFIIDLYGLKNQFFPNGRDQNRSGIDATHNPIMGDMPTRSRLSTSAGIKSALPLVRKNKSKQEQLLRLISHVMPGWRFTMIAHYD